MAGTTEPAASLTNQLRSRRVLSLTCTGAIAALVLAYALFVYFLPAFAQAPRIGGARLGPGKTRPELPELAPEQPFGFELPPVPRPPLEHERRPSTGARVFVREFRLTGNSVFSDQELAAVLEPYAGRALATEELLDARDAVTRLYIERGYVSSGAVIPDQEVVGGVIEIRIVEGTLGEITVNGLKTLQPSFVEERIRLGGGPPLNVNQLRERIQLLLNDPAIDRVNARLGPGRQLGEAYLEVDVEEAPPYRTDLIISNDRPPSIGAEGAEMIVTFGNLLGRSDPLRVGLEKSSGLTDVEANYSVPVTADDLRLFAAGEVANSEVVEEPFNDIDVESDFASIEVGTSSPLWRRVDEELVVGASLEYEQSTTFLLGRRFSFSPGVQDGRSKVTALRLAQQWQRRGIDQVIAIRSTKSIGLPILDATENPGNLPDGRFFAWLGQGQYVRRLNEADWQLALRGDLQLTPDPLLPIEQIEIGGLETVRGYRTNQLVTDNGWVVSAEVRIPLGRLRLPYLSPGVDDGLVQIVPFVDAGGGWNNNFPDPDSNVLYSIGTGLRWQLNERVSASLDYGYPFVNVDDPDDKDIQDYGLFFEIHAALY
jgi:hemolysin activation/secretion protein